MIVVVIIGILAAIAIPNFIAMQNRAKEGSTKANMHTFQLAAEDYGVQNDGTYADRPRRVVSGLLPSGGANFKNPFTQRGDDAFVDVRRWPNAADGLDLAGISGVRGHARRRSTTIKGPRQDARRCRWC